MAGDYLIVEMRKFEKIKKEAWGPILFYPGKLRNIPSWGMTLQCVGGDHLLRDTFQNRVLFVSHNKINLHALKKLN